VDGEIEIKYLINDSESQSRRILPKIRDWFCINWWFVRDGVEETRLSGPQTLESGYLGHGGAGNVNERDSSMRPGILLPSMASSDLSLQMLQSRLGKFPTPQTHSCE